MSFRSQGTTGEISLLRVIDNIPLTLVVVRGKNASLTGVDRIHPCSHATGFAKWCWTCNYTGMIRWEISWPQIKEPLSLEELWLRMAAL